MRCGIIYKATNLINNKCYIGQTRGTLSKRRKVHERVSFKPKQRQYNHLFHRAIRKHGIENFIWEELETCDVSLLNDKEKYYIEQFKSFAPVHKCGYNMTRGGDSIFGSSGQHHYLNRMSPHEKEHWLKQYRIGCKNPNYNNSLTGSNHFSQKMTEAEYDNWVSHFTGQNNYQKRLSKDELKKKNFFNKMSEDEKQIWINNNVRGDKNPFARAVKQNPDLYRGKNHPCYGKSYPNRHVKYVVTLPTGEQEIVTKLVEFCRNREDITPYGLRLVLKKRVDSYRGYRISYHKDVVV
jgi:group I intron endonuclease